MQLQRDQRMTGFAVADGGVGGLSARDRDEKLAQTWFKYNN